MVEEMKGIPEIEPMNMGASPDKTNAGNPTSAEDEVQELDNISSIALLIDDLSHEDPSIKLNALTKLTNIASLIGEARTRDELIPLLIEMLDKIDDNSELMVVMAEQLGLLAAYIGQKEYLPILLKPLEIIANNDEAVVRDKATESICKIAVNLQKDQFSSDVFPLVKKMAKGDTLMMKMSSTALFHIVYPNVTPLNQTMLRQLYVDLCKDDAPTVRRAACANFAKYAQVIDAHFVKAEFISVIQALLTDVHDAVKVSAVECAAKIISLLKNEEVNTILLPSLRASASDKSSWRLRYTLAENTAIILEYLCKK